MFTFSTVESEEGNQGEPREFLRLYASTVSHNRNRSSEKAFLLFGDDEEEAAEERFCIYHGHVDCRSKRRKYVRARPARLARVCVCVSRLKNELGTSEQCLPNEHYRNYIRR